MIWREPCPVPSRWVLDAIAEELLAAEPEWPYNIEGYAEWEREWLALSREERAREIRLMDEHVALAESSPPTP